MQKSNKKGKMFNSDRNVYSSTEFVRIFFKII